MHTKCQGIFVSDLYNHAEERGDVIFRLNQDQCLTFHGSVSPNRVIKHLKKISIVPANQHNENTGLKANVICNYKSEKHELCSNILHSFLGNVTYFKHKTWFASVTIAKTLTFYFGQLFNHYSQKTLSGVASITVYGYRCGQNPSSINTGKPLYQDSGWCFQSIYNPNVRGYGRNHESEPGTCLSIYPVGICSGLQYSLQMTRGYNHNWMWKYKSEPLLVTALDTFNLKLNNLKQNCNLLLQVSPKQIPLPSKSPKRDSRFYRLRFEEVDSEAKGMTVMGPNRVTKSWNQAEQMCNERGSHLLSIHSESQLPDIIKNVRRLRRLYVIHHKRYLVHPIYIGLYSTVRYHAL